MEYEEAYNGHPGDAPEVGAIFMSNIATKKVCFKKKVFALPSSMANFVKQIRAGMVLFLFEFEKRQLFGVYQATSDGAMNILETFSLGGKHFPAQVRFTPIWLCNPLSENEFRDAIRDNYFSARKFKFGLSEDQVRRLLTLFSSRKLKMILKQRHIKFDVEAVGKNRGKVEGHRFSDNISMEFCEEDGFRTEDPSKYTRNSLDKAKLPEEDMFVQRYRLDNEDYIPSKLGLLSAYPGGSFDRKRNMENDGRASLGDTTQNGCYNDIYGVPVFPSDYQNHLFGTEKDSAVYENFLTSGIMDNLPPFKTSEFLGSAHNARKIGPDGRSTRKDEMKNECQINSDFRLAFSAENQRLTINPDRPSFKDGMFFLNDDLGHENIPRHNECDLRKMHELSDHHKFFANDRQGMKHQMHCGHSSIIESGRFQNYFHTRGETTDNLSKSLNNGNVKTDNGGLYSQDKRINRSYFESTGLATDRRYSGYAKNIIGSRDNDGRFGQSDFTENAPNIHIHVGPEIPRSYESKRFGLHPVSHDATITSVSPFDCGIAGNTCFKQASSIGMDHNLGLVRDSPRSHGLGGSLLPSRKGRSSSYGLEAKVTSGFPGFSSGYQMPTTMCHRDYLHDAITTTSPLNVEFPGNRYPSPADPVNNRGSWYSLSSQPLSISENFRRENRDSPSLAMDLRRSIFDKHLPAVSYALPDPLHSLDSDVLPLIGNEFLQSDANLSGLDAYGCEKDRKSDEIEYYKSSEANLTCQNKNLKLFRHASSCSRNSRRSVFTRLTRAPHDNLQEELEKDMDIVGDDYYMDTSVDEIMNMLCQGPGTDPRSSKWKNCKPLIKSKDIVIIDHKKQNLTENTMDYHHAKVITSKDHDASQLSLEDEDAVPQETRALDFKRRSEGKKRSNETSAQENVPATDDKMSGRVMLGESSNSKQQPKRRKLFRPVFTSNNSTCEGNNSDPILDRYQTLVNDNTQDFQNALKATTTGERERGAQRSKCSR